MQGDIEMHPLTDDDVGELDLNKPAIEVLTTLVSLMDANGKDWIQVGFVDQFNEQIILEINICARGATQEGKSNGH